MKRLKTFWTWLTTPSQAIPVVAHEIRKGAHYLLVFDDNMVPWEQVELTAKIMNKNWGVDAVILGVRDVNGIRLIEVEKAEKVLG